MKYGYAMRLELFCMNRPHYTYECTKADLEHLGLDLRGLLIHEPVKNGDGYAHIDLLIKPIEPVKFISLSSITTKAP